MTKNGQALWPMVELIEQSRLAVKERIEVFGRASLEAVLRLLTEGIAGPPHAGKKGGAVGWHGSRSIPMQPRVCARSWRKCSR